MTVYRIDPTTDPRWPEFLSQHPQASIYHSPGWLSALKLTYDYQPLVITTSAPGRTLECGVAFCCIDSWITGRRLVGLPFSDHCEPLVCDESQSEELAAYLMGEFKRERWHYVELRSSSWRRNPNIVFQPGQCFFVHQLDLTPSREKLLAGVDKDSVQRKIRRQFREGLNIEKGRDKRLLDHFYELFIRTRRRHRVPPPPRRWFENLIHHLGEKLTLWVSFKGDRAIASILTLQGEGTLVYKYGCSDERFHAMGGMQGLLWNAVENGKAAGLHTLDMGRTDLDNPGLLRFKNGWGARCSNLQYLVYPSQQKRSARVPEKLAKYAFSWMPSRLLETVGGVLYRHAG